MKRYGRLLIFSLLFACTDTARVPSGIIPPEKMEMILWDMIQADRYSNQFLARDSAKLDVKKETFRLYAEVFSIHQVSQDEFSESFRYYMSRPDLSTVMFDSLASFANRSRAEPFLKNRK